MYRKANQNVCISTVQKSSFFETNSNKPLNKSKNIVRIIFVSCIIMNHFLKNNPY
jgi:hypothetical protein